MSGPPSRTPERIMESNIRYATASDGVSLAYYAIGTGPTLLMLAAGPWAPMQIEWQIPQCREWLETLSESFTIVRYDPRGMGLSDKAEDAFVLDAQVRDADAVIADLQTEQFFIWAPQHAGPVALTYAARNTDRISGLLLWMSYARGADYFHSSHSRALHSMIDEDWELFLQATAHSMLGWSEVDVSLQITALLRESFGPEEAARFDEAARRVDAAPALSSIRCETLVLHRPQVSHPRVEISRGLAAAIPRARLALLDGDSVAPFLGEAGSATAAITEFLGNDSTALRAADGEQASETRTIPVPLSLRESEVLKLLANGMSNQEVADQLWIALGTVKTHVNSIYGKLDARGRTRAIARARELGILRD